MATDGEGPRSIDEGATDREGPRSIDGATTDGRNPFVDALIGAAVTVVLSFLPLSPALGGGVSGYLHGGRGAVVGALSGLLSALPLLFVLYVLFGVFSLALGTMGAPGGGVVVWIVLTLVAVAVALYAVALGAVGGIVGEALADR